MTSPLLIISALTVPLSALLYQFYAAPFITSLGVFRTIHPVNPEWFTSNCQTNSERQNCEKIVLHQESGLVYMACASIEQRWRWLNGMPEQAPAAGDITHLAIYDPATQSTRRVTLDGFDMSRTIIFHGMDVVPDESGAAVYIYLVHHRMPVEGTPMALGYYDSAIEVFESKVGSTNAKHLHTFSRNNVLLTPNDVVGSNDGKSVYFTNDGSKAAPRRGGSLGHLLSDLFAPSLTVGYCHSVDGCKVALGGLTSPNGIATSGNGTLYIASSLVSGLLVTQRLDDNTLARIETIPTEQATDNLSVDGDGAIWGAGLPRLLPDCQSAFDNITFPVPHWTVKAHLNQVSTPGNKYNVQKVVEDDGHKLRFITTVAYDSKRSKLYIHGLSTPYLTVCDYS
ncbi:calcium-dependent phosphotriesterase [Cylindrobasidium torrendii FP15055 ss-10]|uniref:Calcium-dependent phosphotriesterase n=1 Tax=Cylindrobasidium torrendii FP15055 ss-10 TaxID=1314674 RepID=A0A0D7B6W7_9AGAR|nr:calcium-dependent phosphotriesterase [Cylindrobasidium torrendii FP15055 ss-10]